MDTIRNEYVWARDQVWRQRGKAEMVWRCAEEGSWIDWTLKDVEDGAAEAEEKEEGLREGSWM